MIIGASFGGTPSLTATSGPGLSLMIEALGLATAAEIPVVVVEQSHGAQFHCYLRAHYDLPASAKVLHRPGPLPITASEVHHAILEWRS
jgi:pyruvate/2-oxoacid:ferredoxin oxidoreductase alpha subunit